MRKIHFHHPETGACRFLDITFGCADYLVSGRGFEPGGDDEIIITGRDFQAKDVEMLMLGIHEAQLEVRKADLAVETEAELRHANEVIQEATAAIDEREPIMVMIAGELRPAANLHMRFERTGMPPVDLMEGFTPLMKADFIEMLQTVKSHDPDEIAKMAIDFGNRAKESAARDAAMPAETPDFAEVGEEPEAMQTETKKGPPEGTVQRYSMAAAVSLVLQRVIPGSTEDECADYLDWAFGGQAPNLTQALSDAKVAAAAIDKVHGFRQSYADLSAEEIGKRVLGRSVPVRRGSLKREIIPDKGDQLETMILMALLSSILGR